MKKITDILGPEYQDMHPVPRTYWPPITIAYTLVCIALFGLVNLGTAPNSWANIEAWGGTPSDMIWNGQYRGLLINNFIHEEAWHIIFNLYWLFIFGRKIEYEQGPWPFLFLTLTAAYVASGSQMAWDGNMGIGFSGIAYALFGYIFIRSRYDERYIGSLSHNNTILFFVWLIFCVVATNMGFWQVGNGAHIGGMLWGMLIGFLPRLHRVLRPVIALPVFALSLVPAFWAPWQVRWLEVKAYNLHDAQRLDEANVYYDKILAKEPLNLFAIKNKEIIIEQKTGSLKMAANDSITSHHYDGALQLYDSVLAINPKDTIAMLQKQSIETYLKSIQK